MACRCALAVRTAQDAGAGGSPFSDFFRTIFGDLGARTRGSRPGQTVDFEGFEDLLDDERIAVRVHSGSLAVRVRSRGVARDRLLRRVLRSHPP